MRTVRIAIVLLAALVLAESFGPRVAAQKSGTIEQYLSPAYPFELATARTAERLAWLAYDEGKRNVYTAVAPAFPPVRLTSFLKDDGTDLTSVRISDDGSTVVFVRGHAPNRDGWVANPSSDPAGAERAIWAATHRDARRGLERRGGRGARARTRRPLRAVRRATDRSFAALTARRGPCRRWIAATNRSSRRGARTAPALVAGRNEDRVREPADRSQLHRHLRRGDAHHEIHGARRRLSTRVRPGRRTASASRSCGDLGSPFGQQAQQGGGGIGVPPGPAAQANTRPDAEPGRVVRAAAGKVADAGAVDGNADAPPDQPDPPIPA